MCRTPHYIYNRFIHRSMLVSCGKCDSCLQAKANNRANRIRNHVSGGDLCLFITLTYDNKFVPYCKKSDLLAVRAANVSSSLVSLPLPIFRDYQVRCYAGKSYITRLREPICNLDGSTLCDFNYIPFLKKKRDCMGVIYYDDVKNFMKRLRIILSRELNYDKKITYYAVGEYGGNSFRPHFHLLVFFPEGSEEILRPYIIKAWPFGDMSRARKRIQTAINAASYVASYVNKSANLPEILTSDIIRQKHSHSFHFGTDVSYFSLDKILEKVRRGDCTYSREILKDGVPLLVDVPVPDYVVSRYFPKFKGHYLFTDDEVRKFLLSPFQYRSYFLYEIGTLEEFNAMVVRLNHAYQYYHKITGGTIFDYAIDYCSVWRCRTSYIFKHSYDIIRDFVDFKDFYENVNDYVFGLVHSPTLDPLDFRILCLNPSERTDIVRRDNNLVSIKNKVDAIRTTNGLVLSELYDDM